LATATGKNNEEESSEAVEVCSDSIEFIELDIALLISSFSSELDFFTTNPGVNKQDKLVRRASNPHKSNNKYISKEIKRDKSK